MILSKLYGAFDAINIVCIFGKDGEFFHKLSLPAMLNDRQTRPFIKSSGECPFGLFQTDFATGQFCALTIFSWDSPALTFRKKISDRQSPNKADN